MTVTVNLDAWQPILVAIIGACAALAVPIISALLARRDAKRAINTANVAESTANSIGGKIDEVATKLDQHAEAMAGIGVKLNGERTALINKVAQMEQQLIDERSRRMEHPKNGS